MTQGIQDLNNSVELIAERRTYVRGHVRASAGSHPNVSAQFTVTRNNVRYGPYNAINNPITVVAAPDRERSNDSFFFEIPSSVLGRGELRVCMELNHDRRVPELDYSNNTRCVSVSLSHPSVPARVRLFNVQYDVEILDGDQRRRVTRSVRREIMERILNAMESMLPVPRVDSEQRDLVFNEVWSDTTVDECIRVNTRLAERRALDLSSGGIHPSLRYYGVVPNEDGRVTTAWATGIPSRVACGPGQGPWEQDRVAVHELGHCYGRYHAEFCGARGGTPYPYPQGIIGGNAEEPRRFFGWNVVERLVLGPTHYDVMSYCWSYQWISDFTYTGILTQLRSEQARALAVRGQTPSGLRSLIVLGTVNLDRGTAEFGNLYVVETSVTVPSQPSEDWAIELQDDRGTRLSLTYFTPSEPTETEQEERLGYISEQIPWIDGTRRVVVLYRGRSVAERVVSFGVPSVEVLFPNGGETLGERVTVRWVGSDPDGGALRYALQYTNDDGATWETVAADLTVNEFDVDLSKLPGGRNCRFRVIATDGVNTVVDDSDGSFEVGRKPPQVRIVQPATGSILTVGQQFLFVAQGYDPDGDPILDSAYVWRSDRQGDLGVGSRVDASWLALGEHEISVTVVDNDGLESTERIRVTVVSTTPAPTCTGDCDGSGTVTIEELIKMVGIALELQAVAECSAGDVNRDGTITVDEIIAAVNKALLGC